MGSKDDSKVHRTAAMTKGSKEQVHSKRGQGRGSTSMAELPYSGSTESDDLQDSDDSTFGPEDEAIFDKFRTSEEKVDHKRKQKRAERKAILEINCTELKRLRDEEEHKEIAKILDGQLQYVRLLKRVETAAYKQDKLAEMLHRGEAKLRDDTQMIDELFQDMHLESPGPIQPKEGFKGFERMAMRYEQVRPQLQHQHTVNEGSRRIILVDLRRLEDEKKRVEEACRETHHGAPRETTRDAWERLFTWKEDFGANDGGK